MFHDDALYKSTSYLLTYLLTAYNGNVWYFALSQELQELIFWLKCARKQEFAYKILPADRTPTAGRWRPSPALTPSTAVRGGKRPPPRAGTQTVMLWGVPFSTA